MAAAADAWTSLTALERLSSDIGTVTGTLAVAATAGGPDAPTVTESPARAAASGAGSTGSGTLSEAMERRVQDITETSDRVMAQNIALLGEVEAMQKQVAVLRDEKAAMARRLRALMSASEAATAAAGRG